jgi:hypothetical protein
MAKKSDQAAASRETASAAGAPSGFLAEDEHLDRTALLRLGTWAVASVAAVIVAVVASQSSMKLRRDQVAAADLARQSQQIQSVARESANEARRLASAIDTLNGDRDRLFSRMSALEQGLDSVTGSIARQSVAAAAPQPSSPVSTPPHQPVAQIPAPASVAAPPSAPVAAPVATAATAEKPKAEAKAPDPAPAPKAVAAAAVATSAPSEAPAAAPLIASKSMTAPPVAATGKLTEPEPSAKPVAAAPTVAPVPAAVVSAPVTKGPPAPAVVASRPVIGPPAPTVIASVPPADHAGADAAKPSSPPLIVKRTEFGVDVGGANSVGGLRALWRGLLRTRSNAALAVLQPIIVIKEGSNGLGMQLRLVAGPLKDAAAAARICATMTANKRPCETAVFDGQRLAVKVEESATAVEAVSGKSEPDKSDLAKSDPAKSASSRPDLGKPIAETSAAAKLTSTRYRHNYPKRVVVEEPPKPEPTTLSSFFGRRSTPTQ